MLAENRGSEYRADSKKALGLRLLGRVRSSPAVALTWWRFLLKAEGTHQSFCPSRRVNQMR